MKHLACHIVSLLLIVVPIFSFSQSYNKMWKDVEKASRQSLPQTACKRLDNIISVARQDNNNVQMLKALMSRLWFAQDISPDSAKAILPTVEKEAYRQNNKADRCVWHMALGCLYLNVETTTSVENRQKIISAFKTATDNVEIMAKTPSTDYLPLLTKGENSNIYGNDMLSVVFPFAARKLKQLHTPTADSLARDIMKRQTDRYRSENKVEATFLSMLDSADIVGNPSPDFYKEMAKRHADLPLVGELCLRLAETGNDSTTYNLAVATLKKFPDCHHAPALKNIISRLTQPSIHIYTNNSSVYPKQLTQFCISHRNATEVTLSYTKLPYTALDKKLETLTEKDFKRLSKKSNFSKTFSLRKTAPCQFITDTIELNMPEAGIYLLKAQSKETGESFQLLHVSCLAVMQLPLPHFKTKICIADSKNGQPLPYAQITLRSHDNTGGNITTNHLSTDNNGEIVIDSPKDHTEIYASWGKDTGMQSVSLLRNFEYRIHFSQKNTRANIYTDRAIYRPGQKVRVGGFVFNKTNDTTKVLSSTTINIELRNTNHRLIETSTATTDNFGAFETEFTLPRECLNGNFHISTQYGSATFKVEEYKRPRFKIELNQPETAYHIGDTVTVEGKVVTWSGTPLSDAKVCCSVRRNTLTWFRNNIGDTPLTVRDTLTTDSEGNFRLKVALSHSDTDSKRTPNNLYCFTIETKATDTDGETQQALLRLYVGNQRTHININMPDVICKEYPRQIIVTQSNHMGQTIDGKAIVWITSQKDTLLKSHIDFNRKNQFGFIPKLPSGQYKITIMAADDSTHQNLCEKTFALFSIEDQKPMGELPLQVWQSSDTFDNNNQTVDVVVGSPLKDTWLRYDLMANENVIESKTLHISDSILKFRYNYLEKYGDGLHAQFTLLHEGRLYRHSVVLEKPTPDKSLEIKWVTFRDKTMPGAEETWTMQISKKGKPVNASLLATIYDASLNKFRKHSLPFNLHFNRSVSTRLWTTSLPYTCSLVTSKKIKELKYAPLSFTTPDNSLFSSHNNNYGISFRQLAVKHAMRKTNLAFASATAAFDNTLSETLEESMATGFVAEESENDPFDTTAIRTDFSETAFFASSIKTDSCGMAMIEFKLPQSITSWNFMALAHTQDLDHAFADTIIVVEKPFTIEANTPRFLRAGDKTILSVNITNRDTATVTGKVKLLLTDASTGKKLYSATENFSLSEKSKNIIEFPITATNEATLIACRITGTTERFDDGEQLYIPIISDHHKSTTTIPFCAKGNKQSEISLDKLFKQPTTGKSTLTIEYTANPAWNVINALPSTVDHNSDCSTTLAANYAALSIANEILKLFPQIGTSVREWTNKQAPATPLQPLEHNQELKQTALQATPWQQDAYSQRQRLSALTQDSLTICLKQNSMLDKLKALQTAQGGWQWFPGMAANTSITIDIAHSLLLTTSSNLTSASNEECLNKTTLLINKALSFLDKMATKQIEDQKANKTNTLTPSLIKYLYLTTLTKQPTTPTIKKLVATLAKQPISTLDNLYYKSLAACILNKYGKPDEAQKLMSSLMQHTTNDSIAGRFFDSRKAPGGYNSYRMETHLATLNALQQIWPDSTAYINEMTQWLIQSKHTQDWAKPLIAVNAAQYLKKNITTKSNLNHFGKIALCLPNGNEILPANTTDTTLFKDMGYFKTTVSINKQDPKPSKIIISPPQDNSLSLGAAYLTNYRPTEKTQSSSSGFELNIKMYKETASGLQAITNTGSLKKSDRIVIQYIIKALRNYDFVSLTAPRAACMEPTDPLSGYRNNGYKTTGNTNTTWFFDHLNKGEYIIEEKFDIDRTGTFLLAPAQIQCLYAPEFNANSSSAKIIVK
ncbi:MAG: alpha-2-macroglobulin family protein [Prevotellaceae bacterium]|nr:alpha-2-macroglobulin family protein [Prevotellaceae bacterium]